MKIVSRTLRVLAATALAATVLLSQAVAAPLVSIVPADQTINNGDPASVDIIVSGLTDPVGGFSFNLIFDDTIVEGTTYVNDPDGTMGAAPFEFSFGFLGGTGSPLDIFFGADPTETEASLALSQGVSFTLTRVNFLGIANGLSPLSLRGVVLSNWDGTETLPGVQTQDGRICVGGNCATVPEPATLLLFGIALGGLAVVRRRKQVA